MWLIDDARNLEQCEIFFRDSQTIGSFNKLIFKSKTTHLSKYYGIFNDEKLVAYYWLMKFEKIPNTYKAHEIRVDPSYQKQGIAAFFINHILFREKKQILSDHFHSNAISLVWESFRRNADLIVGTYDEITNEIDWKGNFNKNQLYGNDHVHLIVKAK